jgi:hypothetical protein
MYLVSFIANEKPAGSMSVNENMMFAELATKFCQNYSLNKDNKPTFFYNSKEIKSESTRTLKELGITPMAVIHVKTPKDFNMNIFNVNTGNNAGNMGNFQMNNNQFMGNFGNAGYYGYYQNMNPAYFQMNPMYYPKMNMNQFQTNPNQVNPNQFNPNQFNPNQVNPNQVNPNPTNPNPTNPNQATITTNPNANSGNGEFLNITFYYKGSPIQIQSTSSTRFCDLYTNKFIVKAGSPPKPPSFYLNGVRIDSTETKTLKELNIGDKAMIQANEDGKSNSNSNDNSGFLNIIFNCQGRTVMVQATENDKMCDVSKRFCNKGGYTDQDPTFIVNSKKIESTETKTLKELNIHNQARIEVVFTAQVIGA